MYGIFNKLGGKDRSVKIIFKFFPIASCYYILNKIGDKKRSI